MGEQQAGKRSVSRKHGLCSVIISPESHQTCPSLPPQISTRQHRQRIAAAPDDSAIWQHQQCPGAGLLAVPPAIARGDAKQLPPGLHAPQVDAAVGASCRQHLARGVPGHRQGAPLHPRQRLGIRQPRHTRIRKEDAGAAVVAGSCDARRAACAGRGEGGGTQAMGQQVAAVSYGGTHTFAKQCNNKQVAEEY